MVRAGEIVISGLGVVSPIGIGNEPFWEALTQGESGVGPLVCSDTKDFSVPFGGELSDFDPKQYVRPRKSLKVMSREIQLGFSAAVLAVADAGLGPGAVEPERLGVVFGSEMIYCDIAELAGAYQGCLIDGKLNDESWGERAMSQMNPLWLLKYLPNMPACHIGIAHDARGPNNSITHGDVSSLLAMVESVATLHRDGADVLITGGTGSRLNLTGMLWRGDCDLSHRVDDPAGASRPFDASRDGMVNGEGAGAFVVERAEHCRARGAKPIAAVLGYASAFEPRADGAALQGTAIRRVIRDALQMAGIHASDVGHVNAHGLSTRDDDRVEAEAIADELGDVPVTAVKSYFGNLGAGSGAVEAAASILSFSQGIIPRTLNYQQADERCPINVVHDHAMKAEKRVALLLNFTRNGQAVALLLAAV